MKILGLATMSLLLALLLWVVRVKLPFYVSCGINPFTRQPVYRLFEQ